MIFIALYFPNLTFPDRAG